MKLIAFITDTTPPEDEDPKKGAKKEKAASRAGKKGKEDGKICHNTPDSTNTRIYMLIISILGYTC